MATTNAEAVGTPITVRDLLDAGLHFGHQTKRWNPKMKRYIFDKRNGIHIIDLTKSLTSLQEALKYLHGIALSGRKILFVGTKKQAQQVVKESAQSCGQPFVVQRWLGGTLTNNVTIRRSVKRMREIEALETSGAMAKLPKKEVSILRHELAKLQRNLSGIADMTERPGALFVVDIMREAIGVKEAATLGIPVVAIVDTNCDPDVVDYVIPGNDDAIRGIKLVANAVAASVKSAADEYARAAAENAKKRETERASEEARRASARAEAKGKKAEAEKPAAAKKPVKDGDKAAAARPRAVGRKTAKAGGDEAAEVAAPADAAAPGAKAVEETAEA